jgi:large subunit ribosomal protein L19e
MKTLSTQRRLAANAMNVGINKVWFDPYRLNEIKEAITKEDVKALIKEKVINKKPTIGTKRRAGRSREIRKKRGRNRGKGKKKNLLHNKKDEYMARIRKIRSYTAMLKRTGKIKPKREGELNRLAKAGLIRNIKNVTERIK